MVDHEQLDVDALISATWPKGGPYGEYETRNAINAICQLVHYLNYATQRRDSLPCLSTIRSVASGIGGTVGLLDQTLDQIMDQLQTFAADPNLYGDDQSDLDLAHESGVMHAEQAIERLFQARHEARQLRQTLGKASEQLTSLGVRD